MHRSLSLFLSIALLVFNGGLTASGLRQTSQSTANPFSNSEAPTACCKLYLPEVASNDNSSNITSQRTVNAPFFNVGNVLTDKFSEMAIFWFGKISPTSNYADVRVGYNNTDLTIFVSVYDRMLWNSDPNPDITQLAQWDSITLYLALAGAPLDSPTPNSFRFDVMAGDGALDAQYYASRQAAYRGNGSNWVLSNIPFTNRSYASWQDGTTGGYNNGQPNRGYAITFTIPFSSLGLSGPPTNGSVWKLGMVNHNRDDLAGTPIPDQTWPESLSTDVPASWGNLHFGLLPAYIPPPSTAGGTIVIRQGLNGIVVPDAAVGGTINNLCPGDPTFIWNTWSNANFAGAEAVNIQNQGNLSDWPCFAKYYVTFPLNSIPAGKVILSAQLSLYEWGGSDCTQAVPSLIQVLTVGQDWDETKLTWNNAPMAMENIAQTWVGVVPNCFNGWPGAPYTWDVSRSVAQAYSNSIPLRLSLYEADLNLHSGKYFSTSEAFEGWAPSYLVGRPSLTIVWGNPQ